MAPELLIRTARHRAQLSQAGLADRAHMSQPEIARLERPGANPTIQTLARVLAAAGQQLDLSPIAEVDESQIIERLKLTPAERLATFTAPQRSVAALGARRGVASEPLDVERLVRTLAEHEVDFVVIGGIAAVLHGSARTTFDLDISFATDARNLDRLGRALVALRAGLRGVPEEAPFTADAATLKRIDVLRLTTVAGDLDLHRTPAGAPRYDVLARRAESATVGDHRIRVASIEDLIATKTAAGREKDTADLVELEAILRLRR